MAFRQGYPAISAERCRGCQMLGGCTIETADQARAFERAMRSNPAAWTPRDMDPEPVGVGEEFELAPCVNPELHQKQFGQACPRVELWPENETAARIVYAALPTHTRPLLPSFIEALTVDMVPLEAQATVVRAMRALQSREAARWIEKEPEA